MKELTELSILDFNTCVSEASRIDLELLYLELIQFYFKYKQVISELFELDYDKLAIEAHIWTSKTRLIRMSEIELHNQLQSLFWALKELDKETKDLIIIH